MYIRSDRLRIDWSLSHEHSMANYKERRIMYKEINAWSKRKGHKRVRRLMKRTLHLVITFILGIALATIYHAFVTNDKVQHMAESICDNFGRDAEECKSNIGDLLNESDNEVDNNININGGK